MNEIRVFYANEIKKAIKLLKIDKHLAQTTSTSIDGGFIIKIPKNGDQSQCILMNRYYLVAQADFRL